MYNAIPRFDLSAQQPEALARGMFRPSQQQQQQMAERCCVYHIPAEEQLLTGTN